MITTVRRQSAIEEQRLESRIAKVDSDSKVTISEVKNELGQLSTKVITSDGFKTNLVSTLQTDTGIVTDIVNNMMIGESKNLIYDPTAFKYFEDKLNVINTTEQSVDVITPFRASDNPSYKAIEMSVRSDDEDLGYDGSPWNIIDERSAGCKIKLNKNLEIGKTYTLLYNLTKTPRFDRKNLLPNTKDSVKVTTSMIRIYPKSDLNYGNTYNEYSITFSESDMSNPNINTGYYGIYLKLNKPLKRGQYELAFDTKGTFGRLSIDYLDSSTKDIKNGAHSFSDRGLLSDSKYYYHSYNINVDQDMDGRIGHIRLWFTQPIYNKITFKNVRVKRVEHTDATPTVQFNRTKSITPGIGQLYKFTVGQNDYIATPDIELKFPIASADYKLWNWVLMEGDWSKEDIIKADVDGVNKPLSRLIEKKMSDSWAISHLNGAGDLVSQINLNKSGVRIKGENILLDGDVQVSGKAFLDGAVIKNGSIGTAQIADATITNAKIQGLDALKITGLEAAIGKIVTQDLIADRIRAKQSLQIGDDAWLYLRNDMLQIQKGNGTNTGLSIEVSGRILGPTQFNGRPSRHKYSPVMTNAWVESGIQGVNGYPTVYGIRWIGLVSWKTGKYLHIDDGTTDNHHYYVKLEAAQDQSPIENGLRG